MKTRNAPMPRLSASARRAGATKIDRTTGSTFSVGYTPGTVDAVIAALSPLGKIVCAGEGMGIFLTLG